jgi:AcrR family transcriptional regulator
MSPPASGSMRQEAPLGSEQRRTPPTEPKPSGPLPRGRHELSPEEVERHQRARIFAAVAQEMALRGYDELTVGLIIGRARVSRTTFYAQFANKREAVIATHRAVSERLLAILEEACAREQEWPLKVKSGIEAMLDFSHAHPEEARLLATRLDAADAKLEEGVRASQRRLVELLGEGRRFPAGQTLPPIAEEALVGAISMVVTSSHLGEEETSSRLSAQLVQFILAFYLGAPAAAKVVGG